MKSICRARSQQPVNPGEKYTLLGKGHQIYYGQQARLMRGKFEIPQEILLRDLDRKSHFWCFGTTRVGKTRVMENMTEQDIRKGYNLLVIDPKGDLDLFNKIVQVADDCGRLNELMLITPIFPELSETIDPLSHHYMVEELVGHIVSGVETQEKFFFNVAQEVSLAIVQGLLLTKEQRENANERRFNLNDVKNLMSREELVGLQGEVSRCMQMPGAEQLHRDIQKILDSPQDYYSKVSSSLRVALMELSSGNIGRIVGTARGNRFIDRLERGQGVILVAHLGALLTRRAAYTLGRVLVSMIQSFAGRVFAAGKALDPPLCVYADEAQSCLYRGFSELLAKGGGANVWVHGFVQSIAQMYEAVGKEDANAILDNANTKLFLRDPDPDTAEYASQHFGVGPRFFTVLAPDGGCTIKEEEDQVCKPGDIMTLKPREFYLMTYAGNYRGLTADCDAAKLKVEFPVPHVEGMAELDGEKDGEAKAA